MKSGQNKSKLKPKEDFQLMQRVYFLKNLCELIGKDCGVVFSQ